MPLRRSPLRPRSRKRQKLMREERVLKVKLLEERPICEWCQQAPSLDPHHKKQRSAGGAVLDENNIWMLCRECHSYAHAHPEQATKEGWLIRRFGGV